MSKQRCEGIVSDYLKQLNWWYLKLQVMPLAHKKMPADFLVLPPNSERYLIECKQITSKSEDDILKSRFSFDRLSQEIALESFEANCVHNKSFVCLLFWQKNRKSSYLFLIGLKEYKRLKEVLQSSGYSSMSLANVKQYYENLPSANVLLLDKAVPLECLRTFFGFYDPV